MKKVSAIALSILLAACSSAPLQKTDSAVSSGDKNAAKTDINTTQLSTAETEAVKLTSDLQLLKSQSVYLDFDKYIVAPEYDDVIKKQVAFIKKHKSDVVTLEGHADERGSSEYNLALGSRRDSAV